MSIQFTVNKWNYIIFQFHTLRKLLLVIYVFLFFSAYLTVDKGSYRLIVSVVLFLFEFSIFNLLYLLVFYLLAKLSKGVSLGQFELSLAPHRLIEQSSTATSEFDYSIVSNVAYSFKQIYIYLGPTKAILVPVSAFASVGHAEEFLDVLFQRCGKSLSDRSRKKLMKQLEKNFAH